MTRTRRQVLRRAAAGALGLGSVATLGLQGARRFTDADASDRPADANALVAGSLLVVAEAVPGATVEAHGSLTVRNLVVDGGRNPDVLALADPDLFSGISEGMTLFATNALVLAYHPDSAHADAIETDWASALERDGLRVGRTDPKADPLGYRTVLALDLAANRGLADRDVLDESMVFPETALMRALETGKLDAAFVYRNMAVQHRVPAVNLPASIDFSDPTQVETYATVSLDLPDRTVRGAPIRYAATALTDRGEAWCDTLVSDATRLREHGFTVPSRYPSNRSVE